MKPSHFFNAIYSGYLAVFEENSGYLKQVEDGQVVQPRKALSSEKNSKHL